MELPPLDQALLQRWGMLDGAEILPGGWCSRVYATDDLVIKVPFVGEEITYGSRASVALSGRNGLEVLDRDPESGALLMRRIRPGKPLSEKGLSFADMREIFVEMFHSLNGVVGDDWMTISDYYEENPELQPLVEALDRSTLTRQFIHGDLHHSNILENHNGWTLIDPKGLYADPHYELVAWLANPIDRLREVTDLAEHIGQETEALCSQLSLDARRVIQWGMLDTRDREDPQHPWARLKGAYQQLSREYGL